MELYKMHKRIRNRVEKIGVRKTNVFSRGTF